jgi:hypothetical protein
MARPFSILLGVVLLAVGLCGTATGSHNHKLVVFGINASHNLVHVLSGALAIAAGLAGARYATIYCLAFGTVYGLVAVLGFFNVPFAVNLLNLNMPDNFLHLAISVACLWVGGMAKSG